MGRPPAVVIVARHGARLDAADTQWHLTSPTPYDPPLTYGGWRQSQALGARIGSIIHFREAAAGWHDLNGAPRVPGSESDAPVQEGRPRSHSHRGRRRKHKVVIHSSPFLRCVQTSIAISAGMAQYQGSPAPNSHQPQPKPHVMHSGSPHLRPMDHYNSPHLSAIPEPRETNVSRHKITHHAPRKMSRAILRVDAFLGEWLSPDYFAKITPPPGSKMMVAGAKADLLRLGEPVDTPKKSSSGNFPGGWNSTGTAISSSAEQSDDDSPLTDLSTLSQNLPRVGRANSHNVGSVGKRSDPRFASRMERSPTPETVGYTPPTPSYAISPSQPIPQGYVAHARDACLKVDYQWDSQRPPLDWGDGGEYGEEWSHMHKRFRRGLQDMISWYRNHSPAQRVESTIDGFLEQRSEPPYEDDEDDDEETDTILVLVTHGAGCNALIGALTNQPVLIDVGMASLTMAVRKTIGYKRMPSSDDPPISPSRQRRRSSMMDLGISEDYEVKLIASTEHLRAGSQFLTSPQIQRSPTIPAREKSPYRYERPGFATSHASRFITIDDDPHSESDSTTPTSANFKPLQRSATAAVQASGGLWSKPIPQEVNDAVENESKVPRPQAGQNAPLQPPNLQGASDDTKVDPRRRFNGDAKNGGRVNPRSDNDHPDDSNHGRSIAPNGLWGAPPQALATERDKGAKRRWTLSQAS